MDPTERAVARPVPRRWLDPHVVDAERLDRLLGDRELAAAVHAAGYTGPEWDYVAEVLLKYGYAVLIAWMRNGTIWRRLAERRISGLPAPPPWEWTEDTWIELAGDTLIIALEKFRDTVLATGYWNPQRGASLKTFFIGQCLIRFPNPYRSWHTAVMNRQLEVPDDLEGWKQADPATRSPEQDLVRRDEIARGLAGLDERTRQVLLLLDQGYDQFEVAARLGTTRKSVEMIVRRHRVRQNPPPAQPRRGRHGAAS